MNPLQMKLPIYFLLLFFFFFLFISMAMLSEGTLMSTPPNCVKYECPKYSVVDSMEDFEIRKYNQVLWVSSPPIPSDRFEPAGNHAFLMLYNYTNGSNAEAAKLNLTAPVLVDSYTLSPDISAYTLYFYVDPNFQKSPPLPLSDGVELVQLPQFEYAAVRRFGEFINETTIPSQIAALKNSLQNTAWETAVEAAGPLTVAAYSEPEQKENRINEAIIWFDNEYM